MSFYQLKSWFHSHQSKQDEDVQLLEMERELEDLIQFRAYLRTELKKYCVEDSGFDSTYDPTLDSPELYSRKKKKMEFEPLTDMSFDEKTDQLKTKKGLMKLGRGAGKVLAAMKTIKKKKRKLLLFLLLSTTGIYLIVHLFLRLLQKFLLLLQNFQLNWMKLSLHIK